MLHKKGSWVSGNSITQMHFWDTFHYAAERLCVSFPFYALKSCSFLKSIISTDLSRKRLSEFVFCLFLSLFYKSLAVKFHDAWETGATVICTEVPVVLLLYHLCKFPQSVKGKWHPRVHVKMLGDTRMHFVELPKICNSHY